MDLGKNICVGEQRQCYANAFKQLMIGLEEAKTTFCLAAESDCLYPPEYFQFEPEDDKNVFRYDNIWVYYASKHKAWKKPLCEGAQICGRQYWLERIWLVLGGRGDWENPIPRPGLIFKTGTQFSWKSDNPVITFKTRYGVNYGCGFDKNISSKTFPFWGTSQDIYEKYIRDTL